MDEDAGSSKSYFDDEYEVPERLECSSPVHSTTTSKQNDTVEVPVALLDMLVDNWSRSQDLYHSSLKGKLDDGAESCGTSSTTDDLNSVRESLASISPLPSPG